MADGRGSESFFALVDGVGVRPGDGKILESWDAPPSGFASGPFGCGRGGGSPETQTADFHSDADLQNSGKYLRAAVNSVIAQTYPNWELCICDDHSEDESTLAALRELEPARSGAFA